MIKVDLITGFLGSGKTSFIKQYVDYLVRKGQNIGIIENDYGAVNVDMLLLEDAVGSDVDLEMVAGGCDYDCHRRRFKTKLIALGMLGYDRVLIEPSGIYDVDEFFDVLNEDPLNRWYEVGNVITVIDAKLEKDLSAESNYLLCSQVSRAGKILLSHADTASPEDVSATKAQLAAALTLFKGDRVLTEADFQLVNNNDISDELLESLISVGSNNFDHEKLRIDDKNDFNSVYLLNPGLNIQKTKALIEKLYSDENCGKVFRVKGFVRDLEAGEAGGLYSGVAAVGAGEAGEASEDSAGGVCEAGGVVGAAGKASGVAAGETGGLSGAAVAVAVGLDASGEAGGLSSGSGEAGKAAATGSETSDTKYRWYQINATKEDTTINEISVGQDVVIIIGEGLNEEYIRGLL